MKFKLSIFIVYFFAFAFISSSWADFDPAAQMKSFMDNVSKQMAQMQKTIEQQNDTINRQNDKIRQLESREPQVQMAAPSGEAAPQMTDEQFKQKLGETLGGADKWLKNLKFSGDLRTRYDGQFFKDKNITNKAPDADRNRFRFRLRYGFEKKISNQTSVGFSMGTGELLTTNGLNADQTSQNQTFGNLFNYKNIWIDKAYANYSPEFAKIGPIEKLQITGGKWANVFQEGSTDMIWDPDVTPEGVYEKFNLKLLETPSTLVKGSLTAGQMVLQESATHGKDAELYAFQAVLNPIFQTPLSDHSIGVKGAVSYYYYDRYTNNSNDVVGAATFARGNSDFAPADGILDALAFHVFDYYGELSFNPFGNVLLRPFAEFANNIGDQSGMDENKAYQFGIKIGDMKKKGDWQASYAYKRIANDAVVGAFNDSDFGNGYAGKVGSVIKLGYQLSDNVVLNWAGYVVDNLTEGTAGVKDQGQYRMQADILWKF